MQIFGAIGVVLLAQFHCAAMCGPFVGHYAKSTREFTASQTGRVFSYALLGALAATVGAQLRPYPIAAATFCILIFISATIGIFRLFGLAKFQIPFPTFALRLTAKVQQRLTRFRTLRAFTLGFATPLIPCGQLWIVIGFAGLSNSALAGGATGLIFGLGTIPGVYAFTWIRNRFSRLKQPFSRRIQTFLSATLLTALAFSATMSFVAAKRSLKTPKAQIETQPLQCH